MRIAARVAVYPSSPKGTQPLDEKAEEDVWDAGYEAASWAMDKYQGTGISGEDLFLLALNTIKDPRLPKGMNESHPQFWEYLGTFIDGAKSFGSSQGLNVT